MPTNTESVSSLGSSYRSSLVPSVASSLSPSSSLGSPFLSSISSESQAKSKKKYEKYSTIIDFLDSYINLLSFEDQVKEHYNLEEEQQLKEIESLKEKLKRPLLRLKNAYDNYHNYKKNRNISKKITGMFIKPNLTDSQKTQILIKMNTLIENFGKQGSRRVIHGNNRDDIIFDLFSYDICKIFKKIGIIILSDKKTKLDVEDLINSCNKLLMTIAYKYCRKTDGRGFRTIGGKKNTRKLYNIIKRSTKRYKSKNKTTNNKK